MKMRISRILTIAVCLMLSAVAVLAQTTAEPATMKRIKAAITKVRSGKTVDDRTAAAEHLARLTEKFCNKGVPDALVTDLTSLLDSPDDSVRYWVATALGNLGSAAKAAAPKLQQMLPKADCINGAITSASGIRYALIQMGINPPPPPDCQRIAG